MICSGHRKFYSLICINKNTVSRTREVIVFLCLVPIGLYLELQFRPVAVFIKKDIANEKGHREREQ